MFFRLIELIIALYYGALEDPDSMDSMGTKPPLESSVDREVPCEYLHSTWDMLFKIQLHCKGNQFGS